MSDETYTFGEAMKRLRFRSVNAFYQLERKHPDAFVIMKRGNTKGAKSRMGIKYRKATLDKFAEWHEQFKQGKP